MDKSFVRLSDGRYVETTGVPAAAVESTVDELTERLPADLRDRAIDGNLAILRAVFGSNT